MLHHAALEVNPDAIQEEVAFWNAIGFTEVPVPKPLGDGYTWVEHQGTQIHLIHAADPVIPAKGHVAVVANDFEATLARLADRGFDVRQARELWGEKRAKATSPAGHTVELMAALPRPVAG